ncbi:MAG: hypothetical protein AAGF24_15495, partial [Cyanobacteria bacterium P01_H01_bin.121]
MAQSGNIPPAKLWLPSLHPRQQKAQPLTSDWQVMLSSLATLHIEGIELNWQGFTGHSTRPHLALPTYPFQRQHYWVEAQLSQSTARLAPQLHPLVGSPLNLAQQGTNYFENTLDLAADLSYLREHQVFGIPVLPAVGFLEMAIAASHHLALATPLCLESVAIQQALCLDDQSRTIQVVLQPSASSSVEFTRFEIFSQVADRPWVCHVSGQIRSVQSESSESLK